MFVAWDAGLIEDAGQYLSMIHPNREIVEAQRDQRIACRRDQFSFDDHRTRTQHINIALIEFAEASARGTIGAPDGLNLVTPEKLGQLVLILRDYARQRDSQIVTQREIGFAGLFMLAALENFEDELIAFFTILAHQGVDIFDGGSFQRLKTVALVNLLDDADDVFALAHVGRQKVAHAARGLGLW